MAKWGCDSLTKECGVYRGIFLNLQREILNF